MHSANKNSRTPLGGASIQHRRISVFARSLKVWLITGLFVLIMLGVVAGTLFALRRNSDASVTARYDQQKLSDDALESLKKNKSELKDYLLQIGLVTPVISTPDVINNIVSTSSYFITNDNSTVENVTNNSYTTTELVTNNNTNITQLINTIVLLPGDNIAVSEADGKYTISTVGTANNALSNLASVAINTSLLPAESGQIDVGSSTKAYRNGYFQGAVFASSINEADGGALAIGNTSSGVTLDANTVMATGRTFTADGLVAATANTGRLLVKGVTNSTGAFEVQRASGATIFTVNATNASVGIGAGNAPANRLSVGTLTTADSTAQVAVSTAAGNKGLIVQGSAGQYANLVEVQSSDGTALTSISSTGLTTNGLQVQSAGGSTLLRANATLGGVALGVFNSTTLISQTPSSTVTLNTPAGVSALTSADFNADGRPDVATVSASANKFSIYLNNGGGNFASRVDYATGTSPSAIVSADFNSDGRLDLAVVNQYSNNVSVYLGTGTGVFGSPTTLTTESRPRAIISADFNGDTRADLAVANYDTDVVSVLIGNGAGSFAAKVNYVVGNGPVALAGADFNGDGRIDLAVSSQHDTAVSVLMNAGAGTFNSRVSYSAGKQPVSIVAANLRGDARPDIAIANQDSNTVSVLTNTGSGSFAGSAQTYTVGSRPVGMAAVHYYGDASTDLVVANQNSSNVSMLWNNSGSFSSRATVTTGSGPLGIVVADFNADGRQDLATANGGTDTVTISMLSAFVTSTSQEPVANLVVDSGSTTIGQVVQGSAGQTADLLQIKDAVNEVLFSVGATGNTTVKNALEVAGTLSVSGAAVFGNAANSTSALRIQDTAGVRLLNADTQSGQISIGSFSPTKIWNQASVTSATVSTAQAINDQRAFADFDHNGYTDMAYLSNQRLYFSTSSSASYFSTTTYIASGIPGTSCADLSNHTLAFDINGDGWMDVATMCDNSLQVAINTHAGGISFSAAVRYPLYSFGDFITAADFNGDGRQDLAIGYYSQAITSIYLSNSNGTLATRVDYAVSATSTDSTKIVTGDIDGDGDKDIITNSQRVLLNNGNGSFSSGTTFSVADGYTARGVTVGDFTGDGRLDVAVALRNTDKAEILIGDGHGLFTLGPLYTVGDNPAWIEAADFNGDGWADIVTANTNSMDITVILNNPEKVSFDDPITYSLTFAPTKLQIADFDMNGQPDLYAGQSSQNAGKYFVMAQFSSYLSQMPSSNFIVNSKADTVGQIIQGTANQTADLFKVLDNNNSTLFGISAQGNVVTAGSVSSSGLMVQGIAGSGNNLLQVRDSSGNDLVTVGDTGLMTVRGAIITQGSLSVGGHVVITAGQVPTYVAGAAACTSPTISIAGTDTSGTITITTGTGCATAGTLMTMSFRSMFASAPRVMLSAGNATAAGLSLYSDSSTTTNCTIDTLVAPQSGATYKLNYWIVQ